MIKAVHSSNDFSLTQARHIIKDLFQPNAAIYWTDFLLSFGVGVVCFHFVLRAPMWSPRQAALFIVAAILYYRSALFVHELAHFRENTFRAFRITWNLLCGIPFLMPSFMYYTHVDHHMRKHFGTERDGEYLALGTTPPYKILLYLLQPLVIPLLAIARFLILAPLSWLSPVFRRFVDQRASSLVMDPSYIRPLPTRKALRNCRLQEVACFLFTLGVAVLLIRGWLALALLIQVYLISVFILTMNHIRTLGAHRYTNPGGEMTFVEQLLDSANYPRWPLVNALIMPVGLRYHALHHLCPSLPYHALGRAHRRLMAELPSDSPYRRTVCPSLIRALRQLWQAARDAQAGRRDGQEPADAKASVRARGNHAPDRSGAMSQGMTNS